MKVLFDNNVPAFLAALFAGHEVMTAARQGWEELANGNLLLSAERAGFDLLVTLDRGFSHQQNPAGRTISVLILVPGSQKRGAQEQAATKGIEMLPFIRPGSITICGTEPDGNA